MTTYPNSIGGTTLKKKAASSFSRLAIIGFLLITLVTAILTYQLGHEMAVQISANRGSNSVMQQSSPALSLPASGTGAGAGAGSSNPSNTVSASNARTTTAGSTAKVQTGPISQQAQPKATTQAS